MMFANALILSSLTTQDEYFGAYSVLSKEFMLLIMAIIPIEIHREMLGDVPRTTAYQKAIEHASSWLK